MSQVKLNLQPPPNVDFVTGYPGIPPGPERPQAAVKGAIEVRIPASGVKAKWVRIELRKVETLPGGGPANTFYDFVGPSPVNLWSSPDEYSLLRSEDFQFSIRIPESIPPTVALDGRAGIGYELVASVCTKGKRGFLRKAKSVVVSTISPIIIDKHELHSTWPVYCQPETRHIAQDGVNLSVQRNNTCYGPGDRISVIAVVKSDNLHTIILRSLELSLKEITVYRAGILGPGKKSVPQERQVNIAEGKLGVNATLYGGSSHTAELSCMLSPSHTTTTLNAARHIDITYTLCIKALLGTGSPVVMELPVIISNWQRNVSHEAISRIGPASSLSLSPAGHDGSVAPVPAVVPPRVNAVRGRPAEAVAATLPLNRANFSGNAGNAYNTLPISSNIIRPSDEATTPAATRFGANGLVDEFGSTKQAPTTSSNSMSARPTGSGGGNRFTVTNPQPQDIPQLTQRSANSAESGPSSGPNGQRQWPTSEEEKLRLYEKARAQVAKVQGPNATPPPAIDRASPPPQVVTATPPRGVTATPPRGAAATVASPTKTAWMTAEEEKLRLFQQAQAAVQKNQGLPPPAAFARGDSDPSSKGQVSSGSSDNKPPSAAAALYAQAINAQGRSAPGPSPPAATATTPPPRTKPVVPQYLTAAEEKAALKRYEEAKRAVDRTQNYEEGSSQQNSAPSAPIDYNSLFPAAASTSRPVATDEPPPFSSSSGIPQSHLSEKERLGRAYEANDAAARARQNHVDNSSPPPPVSPPTHSQYTNALEEKEALKKKFEAMDKIKSASVPQTPPRAGTVDAQSTMVEKSSTPGRSPSANAASFRPTPLPPAAGSSRVLTAAEEKALLRAKFEARDAPTNRKPPVLVNGSNNDGNHGNHGNTSNNNNLFSLSAPPTAPPPTAPPPLMPRPPVEYIKETQEEDARLSKLNGEVALFDISPDILPRRGTPKIVGTVSSSPLDGGNKYYGAGFDGMVGSSPTKLSGP